MSIQAETWLATYPNEAYGITKEDILAKDLANPARIDRWKASILRARAAQDIQILVAKQAGETVGYCLVSRKEGEERYVHGLYVRPSAQGRGSGKALLLAALAWLGEDAPVSLGVAAYNVPAITLYQKCGFVMVAEPPAPIPPFASGAQMPVVKMTRPAKS